MRVGTCSGCGGPKQAAGDGPPLRRGYAAPVWGWSARDRARVRSLPCLPAQRAGAPSPSGLRVWRRAGSGRPVLPLTSC